MRSQALLIHPSVEEEHLAEDMVEVVDEVMDEDGVEVVDEDAAEAKAESRPLQRMMTLSPQM